MFARNLRHTYRRPFRRPIAVRSGPRRHYVSQAESAPIASMPADNPNVAALQGLVDELDRLAPRYDVDASQIQIIDTPSAFYKQLTDKISKAKKHVFLSTLYIGKDEHDLMNTMRRALEQNPALRVSLLTDALRGTREHPKSSCLSLIGELQQDFPDRVSGFMFHTPNMRGIKKRLVPKRINEGWGLQHMKLYGVDDEIILSGANLSNDYFTNRQDRYHAIKAADVTNHYRRVFEAVCEVSLPVRVGRGEEQRYFLDETGSPSLDEPAKYKAAASRLLGQLLQPDLKSTPGELKRKTDTSIYPVFQLSPILQEDVSTELPAMRLLLRRLASPGFRGSRWLFTAGYFNMTTEMQDLLLATNPASATVVAASPWANGFYGSKGVSGMLPAAYTFLARRFLTTVDKTGLSGVIQLKEWRLGTVNQPGGWTYHAKGLWLTLPHDSDPSLTLIGSSNYTKRSHSLDLEANALIVTTNPDLKKRLGQEQTWLQKHAKVVSQTDFEKTDRRVGLHVRIAMWIVTLVGGAL